MIVFKHILVPTDGSKLSQDTVLRAIAFARDTDARITFMFAKPDYSAAMNRQRSMTRAVTPQAFATLADEEAREILSFCDAAAASAGIVFESISIACEQPYEAIISCANEAQCDLIFMASHGRRGLSAMLLGSETHRVLTHSKIPVLVCR